MFVLDAKLDTLENAQMIESATKRSRVAGQAVFTRRRNVIRVVSPEVAQLAGIMAYMLQRPTMPDEAVLKMYRLNEDKPA